MTTAPTTQHDPQPPPPYALGVPELPAGADVALSAGGKGGGDAASAPECVPCPNCGCGRMERFCPSCGQENTDPVVPLRYLLRDMADEVLKVDGRIWATLRALLFRPGQLTRDFLDGRRAAYVGPLKLYLAVSTAYFLVFSLTGTDREMRKNFDLGTQVGASNPGVSLETTIRNARQAARAGSVPVPASAPTPTKPKVPVDAREEGKAKRLARAKTGAEWFFEHMSVIGLALLPIYAGLLGLFYVRRRRELPFVAHLIFTLHSQSALYLYFVPCIALKGGPTWSLVVALVVSPLYSYFALRRAYDCRVGAPRWKTAVKSLVWTTTHFTAVLVLGILALIVYILLPLSWF